jgi:hypothetical protein
MPVANIGSKWVAGNLVVFNRATGDVIVTVKADGTLDVAAGATGEFTSADDPALTVTVTGGIITAITEGE